MYVYTHTHTHTHTHTDLIDMIAASKSKFLPAVFEADLQVCHVLLGLFWLCIRSLLAMYEVSFDTHAHLAAAFVAEQDRSWARKGRGAHPGISLQEGPAVTPQCHRRSGPTLCALHGTNSQKSSEFVPVILSTPH